MQSLGRVGLPGKACSHICVLLEVMRFGVVVVVVEVKVEVLEVVVVAWRWWWWRGSGGGSVEVVVAWREVSFCWWGLGLGFVVVGVVEV